MKAELIEVEPQVVLTMSESQARILRIFIANSTASTMQDTAYFDVDYSELEKWLIELHGALCDAI